MLALLAQTDSVNTTGDVFTVIPNIFSRMDALAHPDQLVPQLQALGLVWAIVFLITGLMCMINGYKNYKIATVILALGIGLFAGYRFGESINANAYIVGGCIAALMAVCCFPLMKYAVAVLGGLSGAFLGANLWTSIATVASPEKAEEFSRHHWVGALMGLIICGMLAFVLFKLSIILFTSVGGATIAAIGGIALLLSFPASSATVSESIQTHAITIPMLVFVPALIALILQQTQPEKAGGGGGGG